ncbi:MAG: hypothetical protein FWD69_11185 [Polyangiaceae bacterium]|nr:hypothetical protein [Polyangiaceae bacterium]
MFRFWLAFVLVTLFATLGLPRQAFAEQPAPHTVPVAVLVFDSQNAAEQADALSGALRSRIRTAAGWSLLETTQSLGMLTAALNCPPNPPPECQQRIAEHVKADRYIWGVVGKGPLPGQVTAQIHFFQKNKPETIIKETYTDNLRDSNDDTLRKIAASIIERLGASAVGTVVVHAGQADGEIVLDGDVRVPMKGGTATAVLADGSHSIEIIAPGFVTTKRNVLVTAGKETPVEIALVRAGPPPPPLVSRKVIGGVALGAGVVLGAVAVQQALFYGTLQNRGKDAVATHFANNPTDTQDLKPWCRQSGGGLPELCTIDNRSKQASAIAIVTGALGVVGVGAGLYFLLTGDNSSSATPPSTTATHPRVIPAVGAGMNGLMIDGAF